MMKLNNRFWFRLHGWFSLPIWGIFCFICLTGTISILSHELTWLTNASARASNPQQLLVKPAAELVAAVQAAHPTADITAIVFRDGYLATNVLFSDADKPFATAYVNQYTGKVQEVNDGNTFINFMRSLHGWLLFPWQRGYSIGYYLVSAMAFVTLGALATGLVVYKKFWRGFFKPKLRFGGDTRTTFNDLHRLSGIWSIWFLLIMGLTGLWYFVQAIMWHAELEIEPYPGVIAVEQLPAANLATADVNLQQALDKALTLYPNLRLSYVGLPEHNRDTYKVFGYQGEVFYDTYSYLISVNPWTGEATTEYRPETMDLIQSIAHIADPLHYGTLGGIWTKLIWFLFGLVLTGMSITGFVMWQLRTLKPQRARKRASLQYQAQPR